jgi:hypothetical protein
MANIRNISADGERIRMEKIPSDAMQYVCPVCLAEGSTPTLVKHHADCPYLKRRYER